MRAIAQGDLWIILMSLGVDKLMHVRMIEVLFRKSVTPEGMSCSDQG